jgi:3-oxosteroid 1-dehydrogenase
MGAPAVGTAEVDWAEEHDVLVAGSGGGGVTGAYTAAREGLDVLLIESTERFGGTTAYSGGGGVWFPCNPCVEACRQPRQLR